VLGYGMGIQWKRVSCVYIPSILYSAKDKVLWKNGLTQPLFVYRACYGFFFRATTLHTCPKKFGNLQLYILVECKEQGAFENISNFDSVSIIVSKVLNATLSTCKRVEQCLDVGIKSLQATSLGLSKKCTTITCVLFSLCDFNGF
jgi:hypothetical protein